MGERATWDCDLGLRLRLRLVKGGGGGGERAGRVRRDSRRAEQGEGEGADRRGR